MQDHQGLGLGVEVTEVLHRPRRDPFGVLVRGGRRTAARPRPGAGRGEEGGVEAPTAVGPFAPADEGERPSAPRGADIGRTLDVRVGPGPGCAPYWAHGVGHGAAGRSLPSAGRRVGRVARRIADPVPAHAKALHPDRNPGDELVAERFKDLTLAYQTLIRPRSRAAYDRRHHPPPGATDPGRPVDPVSPLRRDPIFRTEGRARAAVVSGVVLFVVGVAGAVRRGARHRRRGRDRHPVDRRREAAAGRSGPGRCRPPSPPADCYWAVTCGLPSRPRGDAGGGQTGRSRRLRDHGRRRGRGHGEGRVRGRRPQPSQASADALVAGLEKSLGKQVEKGRLEDTERQAILQRLSVTTDLGELADCDLVVESVIEDLATKRHLFNELDRVCDDGAVLATNTSTLPVVDLAMETGRPDQVCGIHFFNPAPMMALVEVVRAITTSDETVATARAFAERCGKTVVDVHDQAGFIVNALLFPYLNNAVKLLDAGVATRDDIDAAMKGGCNFPMGPLELLDLVGLDTSLAILEALYAEFNDPDYRAGAAAAPHGERRAVRAEVPDGLLRLPALSRHRRGRHQRRRRREWTR